jgi:murein L,D-transpeptidase YafK
MKGLVWGFALAAAVVLSGCSGKIRHYSGPEITQIIVKKGERRMLLMHESRIMRVYNFDLGFAPVGDKQFEGDGKTPEGIYFIDRRNPRSEFHLSLGISYPNAADRAEAQALGKSPGGEIFIHGQPPAAKLKKKKLGPDWTAGCISVTNREIEEIYAMVRDGTPIAIYP